MIDADIPSPRFLLVEGTEDYHVVRAIRERSPSLPPFEICEAGGIDELLERIDVESTAPGREIVGFVLDGNDDPSARWAAIRHRLRQANLPDDPPKPDPDGTIIRRTDGADVGVWMMPDNGSPGELEDFLATLIPQTDGLWGRSRKFVKCIPESDRKFPKGKTLRAQIHVWLSVQKRPLRSGQAIIANKLDLTGDLAQRFLSWLAELFDPAKA